MAEQNRDTAQSHDIGRVKECTQVPSRTPHEESPPSFGEKIALERAVGNSAMDVPVERHAKLLSDSRLSQPANEAQRTRFMSQIQLSYGNAYVQTVLDVVRRARAESFVSEQRASGCQCGVSDTSGIEMFSAQHTRPPAIANGAAPGVYRKDDEENEAAEPRPVKTEFRIPHIPWDDGVLRDAFQPPSARPEEGKAAGLPSRVPFLEMGNFSLGLGLGPPEKELERPPDAPEPPVKEFMNKAELMHQEITGKIPSSWESLDKGRLAKAVWGIVREKIAPDLAQSIASRLSGKAAPSGTSLELDIVIMGDFSGAGLTFRVIF